MSKKKAIKLVTASAIAASAFAAVAPTQSHAATSINTVVANAQKSMRAPFDKYYQTGITKKTVPAITVQNLINAGQKAYTDASAAVKKAGGKYAKTNQAKLDSYKKYLDRSKAYVSALNEISLIYKQADGAVKAENLGDLKSAEAVLKNASNKGFVAISKVYGPATRDVLKATFTRLSKDKLTKVQYTIAKVTSKVESVNAINATTVEVTMKDAVNAKNLDSLHFTIDGLTVTNAAVKQTNDKVVVLTTSVQDGAKEYSVKLNGDTLGFTFKGRSAVLPTSVSFVSSSQQAKVGGQVTVKADIGQKVAGVPVTFNIDADKDTTTGSFNKDQVVEVLTNADGIAEYSYTQYNGGEDTVVAYATGNPNVRSIGKVYWGVNARLTVEEVTTADTLANGSKKVYKVKATTPAGNAQTGYVNVAFAENVNVTPDKGVRGASITDASYGTTPYQYTNGNTSGVRVKLSSAGEATFTVTGADASVTPIVFIDGEYNTLSNWTGDDKLASTELQAKADTVKFENIQSVQVTVESLGTKDAAGISSASEGGRDYKVTIKDKDGKIAPAGTKAYVTIPTADLDGNVWLQRTAANGGNFKFDGTNEVAVTTDKDGVAKFTLIGDKNDFATPTVFVDNGSKTLELDTSDAQAKGEIVYFGDAVLNAAKVSVVDGAGNEVTSVKSNASAYFEYQVLDQNGKAYKATSHNATFEVFNNGYNKIFANGVPVEAFKHASVPFTALNGKATLSVTSTGVTSVNVNVSGSQFTLGNQTATVSFTDARALPASYTGIVDSIDLTNELITFTNYDAVSYAGSTFKNSQGVVINQSTFEQIVKAGEDKVRVTATKGSDGKYAFEIVSLDADLAVALDAINSATTVAQVEAALETAGLTPAFAKLNPTQKTAVATAVKADRDAAGGRVLSETGLKTSYAAAYKARVDAALRAVEGTSTTQAELQAVPGLDLTAYNALSAADKTAVEGLVYTAASAAAPLADAPALQTIVNKAIADNKAANDAAAVTAALGAINTAFNKAAAAATPTELTAAKTALTNNASTLGISLTAFNAATSAQQNSALNSIMSTGAAATYTAASLQTALNNAVAVATDVTAPTITSAVFDTVTDELTLTFSENVDVATSSAGTIGFNNSGLAGSTATPAVGSPKNNVTQLKLTLANADADAFSAASVIKSITNLNVKDDALNALVLTGLNIDVVAE